MRLVPVLAVLATFGIAVWAIEVALALPPAFTFSAGASLSLGVVALVMVAIVGTGIVASRSTATPYW
ncbi:hypothetical protein HSRCO_2049 [Halanaeroarchaeum sp. HSR-CO]|uniref:hypothetical protein n=1 Tax=Halanaeroarchaeum sp. HSR-CO TaxID=2866382 RepID=UPI00217D6A1F|nr:hypothetical protein [Halanaeroarchaeum sp. HSR-CO]UWG48323.1 hypothetical protein HSRCO_2049 [Halanaeroarchaeum sp. HSR-CO]